MKGIAYDRGKEERNVVIAVNPSRLQWLGLWWGGTLWERRRHRLCLPGGVPLEHETDTLDDTEETGTGDGTVSGVLPAASDGECATGEEATDDGVPWVLALSDGLDGAVEGGEEATPHTEVTAEDGGTGLDGAQRTDAALAHGRVAESLDSVPYDTTDRAHGECAAEIVQNNDGTGVSRVVSGHGRVCAVCSCVGGV